MLVPIFLGFAGLVFIYLEFFLPGGIAAALGILALLAGVILFSMSHSLLVVLLYAAVFSLLCGLSIALALKKVKASGKHQTVYLSKDQSGYQAPRFEERLIGKIATATSNFTPSGHIEVDGELFQAVSQGRFIPKGSKVRIIGGEGARFIVKVEK